MTLKIGVYYIPVQNGRITISNSVSLKRGVRFKLWDSLTFFYGNPNLSYTIFKQLGKRKTMLQCTGLTALSEMAPCQI